MTMECECCFFLEQFLEVPECGCVLLEFAVLGSRAFVVDGGLAIVFLFHDLNIILRFSAVKILQ